MRFVLLLAAASALVFAWTVAVYPYVDVEVYNGSLLLAGVKAFQLWSAVVPPGWELAVRAGNASIPVPVDGDVFVVVGAPREGCDVFLFYSVAWDETAAVAVCAGDVSVVFSVGGSRVPLSLARGVSYLRLPGKPALDVVSSSAPVRVRSSPIVVAFPPAVASQASARGSPWNSTDLLSRLYNVSAACAAEKEGLLAQLQRARREVDQLRGEVAALQAENQRLRTLGPSAIALYASVAVGIAAGILAIYMSKRSSRYLRSPKM